ATEPFEPLETRLALGVDLAAVELLALLVVADNLVGAVQLGELGGRLRILLVGIRMQLLRQLAIGLLDVFRACRLGYPQNLIGVTHCRNSELKSLNPPGRAPDSLNFNVGRLWPLCNASRIGGCSPDEAKRNPGRAVPHFASLHAGYGSPTGLPPL